MLFRSDVTRGHSTILFAEAAGHVVSAHNTAHFKEVSLYWTGASASDAPVGANRLLFDRQIVGARSRSDLVFDCGEAFPSPRGPKERGLSTFKRSFGGVLWPRSAGTQVGMPVVDGLERAWRGVSNLLGTWRSS